MVVQWILRSSLGLKYLSTVLCAWMKLRMLVHILYNYVIFGSMIQMLVGIRVIVQVTKVFLFEIFGSNLYICWLCFVKIYAMWTMYIASLCFYNVSMLSLWPGEKGIGRNTKKPLHYKGTVFHRVIKGFMAQVHSL